jgi:DNA repair exonuclease SbcCD ATPase subunit
MNWEAVSAVAAILGVVGSIIGWIAYNFKSDIISHSDNNTAQLHSVFDTYANQITREITTVRQENEELAERVAELEKGHNALIRQVDNLAATTDLKQTHLQGSLAELKTGLTEINTQIKQLYDLISTRRA